MPTSWLDENTGDIYVSRPLDAWSIRWKNRGMGVWNDKRQYPLDHTNLAVKKALSLGLE